MNRKLRKAGGYISSLTENNFNALTVAGWDPSGSAGVLADTAVFQFYGIYGSSVITAITVQNSQQIQAVYPLPSNIIIEQMEIIRNDFVPHGIKIGMTANAEIVQSLAKTLKKWNHPLIVLDPVMKGTNPKSLLDPDGIRLLKQNLLPLCFAVTPNLEEAEILSGLDAVENVEQMTLAGRKISERGPKHVIVTGGHLPQESIDVLVSQDSVRQFKGKKYAKKLHGTGCAFSSALLSELILGRPIKTATKNAKNFIDLAIKRSTPLGKKLIPLKTGILSAMHNE